MHLQLVPTPLQLGGSAWSPCKHGHGKKKQQSKVISCNWLWPTQLKGLGGIMSDGERGTWKGAGGACGAGGTRAAALLQDSATEVSPTADGCTAGAGALPAPLAWGTSATPVRLPSGAAGVMG